MFIIKCVNIGYFPFMVITKYWFHSPCCTLHPCSLSYTQKFVPLTLLPVYFPSHPLVSTSLFSVSVSLLFCCHIH